MIKRVIARIKSILYSLPFTMKAGEILTTSNKDSSSDVNYNQVKLTKSLKDALLRGEVTQEVEELRYRDYKVSEESRKYKVLSDGVAIKVERNVIDVNNFSFTQTNKQVTDGVLDGMKKLARNDSSVGFTLKVKYTDVPRFKIEKYCTRFKIEKTDEKTLFVLFFDTLPDVYDSTSRMFLNELTNERKSVKLFEDVVEISFITNNVENEKNYVKYTLSELNPTSCGVIGNEHFVEFSVNSFSREDLTEKFMSETMEEKYLNNEKKEQGIIASPFVKEELVKCSVCGKEINKNESIYSTSTIGEIMCLECWKNTLLNAEDDYILNITDKQR